MYPRCGVTCILLLLPLCGTPLGLAADKPREACRSVHLWYAAPEALAYYNEVTVDRSAGGSYFAVCGFHMGYFGIQELTSGKKVVIFSVWEPGKQNNPRSVAEERRVQLIAKGDKVRTGRFGGEGTGGQSFLDHDWKIGETYRCLVTARPAGPRTEFTAHVYLPEEKTWKHMATFSTLASGALLRGYYSFVEDFRRDDVSVTQARQAHYGNGWVRAKEGAWVPLTRARFTADNNPRLNIDAGVENGRFFLATGGTTRNANTKLGGAIESLSQKRVPPEGLPLPAEAKKQSLSAPQGL